jgi:hypothetical protein
LPILAQQKDTANPRIVQQRDLLGVAKALGEFGELGLKLDEAYNKNDDAAVAAGSANAVHIRVVSKTLTFEAFKGDMAMPTATDEERALFRNTVKAELPAFLAYLLAFEVPAHLAKSRCGIGAYHNPALLEVLGEMQPENQLRDAIDTTILLIIPRRLDPWKGYAAQLETVLRESSLKNQVAKILRYANTCGDLLSRLVKQQPERFERRTLDGKSYYTIHPPTTS